MIVFASQRAEPEEEMSLELPLTGYLKTFKALRSVLLGPQKQQTMIIELTTAFYASSDSIVLKQNITSILSRFNK